MTDRSSRNRELAYCKAAFEVVRYLIGALDQKGCSDLTLEQRGELGYMDRLHARHEHGLIRLQPTSDSIPDAGLGIGLFAMVAAYRVFKLGDPPAIIPESWTVRPECPTDTRKVALARYHLWKGYTAFTSARAAEIVWRYRRAIRAVAEALIERGELQSHQWQELVEANRPSNESSLSGYVDLSASSVADLRLNIAFEGLDEGAGDAQ